MFIQQVADCCGVYCIYGWPSSRPQNMDQYKNTLDAYIRTHGNFRTALVVNLTDAQRKIWHDLLVSRRFRCVVRARNDNSFNIVNVYIRKKFNEEIQSS